MGYLLSIVLYLSEKHFSGLARIAHRIWFCFVVFTLKEGWSIFISFVTCSWLNPHWSFSFVANAFCTSILIIPVCFKQSNCLHYMPTLLRLNIPLPWIISIEFGSYMFWSAPTFQCCFPIE